MSTEVSQLIEEVRSDLLNEDGTFSIEIADQVGLQTNEISVLAENPFTVDYSRFLPNESIMTLERFFVVLGELIQDIQKREGIPDGDLRVSLVEDFHPDRFSENAGSSGEIIAYRVKSRKPSNMSGKATGRPQRGFAFDHALRSPEHPNKIIEIETYPIDHEIEISCWAKTATAANARALWLERNLINQKWIFVANGADRFFWTGRGPDTYWGTGGQGLYQRPLTFFLRLREFRVKGYPRLIEVKFKISANSD